MNLAKIVYELSHEMPETLKKVVNEVHDLRATVTAGIITEGPADLHERLLVARKAQDRVEMLVADLGRLHSRVRVASEDLRGELEDAEANATYTVGEYASAKERNAALMLATVDQRIALRRMLRHREEVWEALDYCRFLHRGIDNSRRDLDLRIRLISLQTSLER